MIATYHRQSDAFLTGIGDFTELIKANNTLTLLLE